MKSLYLILAATAVAVTCEPQRSNNDIIWYPVDDEEGVFISTVGEKHRSSPNPKWRSRRPRFSGMEGPLPLSYDPAENYDPSFFHNIHERRPSVSQVPKIPPSFLNQQFPVKKPNKRPQGQGNQILNDNFQEIFNEVFDYNKNPPQNDYQGGNNQWDAQPAMGNQWGRPSDYNQWNRPSGSLVNAFPGKRPSMSNQWGSNSRPIERPTNGQWGSNSRPNERPTNGQWGSNSRPIERPTNGQWLASPTNNRPTGQQSDKLIFPGETSSPSTTTPSNLIPTDPPTMSPCERVCPVTPEFNPVCGSDSMTYSNAGRLKCAQTCGKDVRLAHYGSCGRPPFITPLVSSMPKLKLKFW